MCVASKGLKDLMHTMKDFVKRDEAAPIKKWGVN
jgi:hypothetical protein